MPHRTTALARATAEEADLASDHLCDEALEHWRAQERSAVPGPFADPDDQDRAAPSGWWIAPAVVLGTTAWGLLLHHLF